MGDETHAAFARSGHRLCLGWAGLMQIMSRRSSGRPERCHFDRSLRLFVPRCDAVVEELVRMVSGKDDCSAAEDIVSRVSAFRSG
jgi:hypothetical protein